MSRSSRCQAERIAGTASFDRRERMRAAKRETQKGIRERRAICQRPSCTRVWPARAVLRKSAAPTIALIPSELHAARLTAPSPAVVSSRQV
jgi:hypothetical protein